MTKGQRWALFVGVLAALVVVSGALWLGGHRLWAALVYVAVAMWVLYGSDWLVYPFTHPRPDDSGDDR